MVLKRESFLHSAIHEISIANQVDACMQIHWNSCDFWTSNLLKLLVEVFTMKVCSSLFFQISISGKSFISANSFNFGSKIIISSYLNVRIDVAIEPKSPIMLWLWLNLNTQGFVISCVCFCLESHIYLEQFKHLYSACLVTWPSGMVTALTLIHDDKKVCLCRGVHSLKSVKMLYYSLFVRNIVKS